MSGRVQYHEFDDLDALALDKLISKAKLSNEDKRIARETLIKKTYYADIGEIVHLSRTAVSKRLRKTIVPELNRIYKR